MFLQPRINNHTEPQQYNLRKLFNEQRTEASTGIIKKIYQYLKDVYNANS